MRGHLLTTSGQRLEDFDIRDFLDVVYAYAIAGGEDRTMSRDWFTEYIYDLTPDKIGNADFDVQSKTMINELDAFRDDFGSA